MLAFEDDSTRSVGAGHETLASCKPGGAQFRKRDRDLVFGADRGRSAAAMQWAFSHWPHESLERDRHEVATYEDTTGVATCFDII